MAVAGELMKLMTVENVSLFVAVARIFKPVRLAMALERFGAGLLGRKGVVPGYERV